MAQTGNGSGLSRLWNRDIWQASHLNDHSATGWFYAFLRVVSTTATTFLETKTASRAADLSFSSLLGLGPLIAIAMLVASTLFGERDPNLAVDALNRLISFIAPQLDQYEKLNNTTTVTVNPELVEMINGFIKGARSETAGVVGAILLVTIVLLLFKSIEDAFNEIWGVRRGRTLLRRVAFYWTILTLGGILFFASVALLGAGAFVNVFVGRLPFGSEIVRLLRWSLPSFSFVVLVAILTAFYRAIPNTRVRWKAAVTGAFVVALLLTANNFLQFLYLKRVLLTRSLFGSLGIIPVLMFGLYIFWLFVLVGGQISYAVQNVHVRNSRLAWGSLSAANRERLSLAVLMAICRRFYHSESGAVGHRHLQFRAPAGPGRERVPEPHRGRGLRDGACAHPRLRRDRGGLPAGAAAVPDHALRLQGGRRQPRRHTRRRPPGEAGPRRARVCGGLRAVRA
jgi:membrane protein